MSVHQEKKNQFIASVPLQTNFPLR